MRLLVERHYATPYNRFRREIKNDADAEDLSQKLWLQVAKNLDRYDDSNKFPNYLATIATNLIKGHWRDKGIRERVISRSVDDEGQTQLESRVTIDPAQQLSGEDAVKHLSQKLIPDLPVEQRMAWLLQHEAEYWDPQNPMNWRQIAELNGMEVTEAWACFERAREALMTQGCVASEVDLKDINVFLIWTQAQRAAKEQVFTWDYFAYLLGVPVNTMKTRYRNAKKNLDRALDDYREEFK